MDPLAQLPPAASLSDAGTLHSAHSGSSRPLPRVSGAGAPLTGSYNPQKVYIGNLPDTATLADLEDCFGQLGACTCSIKRGFGFVEYLDPAAAAEAVAKYHEGHFLGAQIKVELSHQRAPPPSRREHARPFERNPPGSDRPSDARKPMHINGPPGADRGGRKPYNTARGPGPYSGRPNQFAPPPSSGPAFNEPPPRFGPPSPRDAPFPSRDAPFPPRDAPFPPRGGDRPPPFGGPPGPDRYREDYRAGPPPGASPYAPVDSRYGGGGGRDYNSGYNAPPPPGRDPRGPPPGGAGGYGPPPSSRDAPPSRPPFDPYYDAPRGGGSSNGYGAPPAPYADARPPPAVNGYSAPPPPAFGGAPPPLSRDPYANAYADARPLPPSSLPMPSYDPSARGLPEPARGGGAPYDPYSRGGPPPSNGGSGGPGPDRYDPRGDVRGGGGGGGDPRYNPYARPPSGAGGPPDPYGGGARSRRSLSPRRVEDPYRPGPPGGGGGYHSAAPPPAHYGGGYGGAPVPPPRYPVVDEPYNPRR